MDEQKLICYTLDLEHDYAGLSPFDKYDAFEQKKALTKLSRLIHRHGLKLTVFATGKVLTARKETVKFFQDQGAEIELHGHHHVIFGSDTKREIRSGVEAYRDYFKKNPMGYRSPGGVFGPNLLSCLQKEGIRYDSSLIPSFRWGVYKNLRSPLCPFYSSGVPVLELPVGVIPRVRLPVAASYIKLFGLSTYRTLFSLCGTPSPLVYILHLVDLIPSPMRKNLPLFWRILYSKSEKRSFEIFRESLSSFEEMGYKAEYMSRLYSLYAEKLSPPAGKQGGHE